MTAQSIVCGSCAAEVPYGRLSCPSCGELLASVAGSRRVAASIGTRSALPDVLYDAGSAPSAAVSEGQLALESAVPDSAAPQPSARDLDDELPWAASTTHGTGVAFDRAQLDGPDDEADRDGVAELDALDVAPGHVEPHGTSTNGGPAWAGGALTGSPTPAYMPRPGLGGSPAAAPAFAGPGAYVPPLPVAVVPAGPPAPARSWAGHYPDADRSAAVASTDGNGDPVAQTKTDPDARARLAEFVGWLFVAGAAFSAVGFLLPWGLVVIGSNDVGYFGRWGIAGPWHVGVVVAVLAVLALALIKNAVPVWIRTGLAGLGLGALILGLVWPYLLWPPMGTGPGAVIAAIGAAALTVSGLLALVADRHVERRRPV